MDRDFIDAWFAPLEPTIRAFVSRHGLQIEKYYHDVPAWSLKQPHPSGGWIQIDVVMSIRDNVIVGGGWYVDDRAAGKRLIHLRENVRLPREAAALADALERERKVLIGLPYGAWTLVSDLAG